MTAVLDRRAALAGLAVSVTSLGAASAQSPGRFQLVAKPAPAKLFAGAGTAAETWAFEGPPGPPVLRLRQGEELHVGLRNETPKPLSLHWHGVRGAAAFDGSGGLSQAPVGPGAAFEYRFTPPDPGTFLVRPIVLGGGSGEPAGRGLAAMLVVEEREPPVFDAEFALLVRDWLAEPSGALAPFGRTEEAALAGRLGNRVSVGADEAPRRLSVAPGARVRLRLANGSNARILRIRFDGMKAYVGAVDGQPTDTFEPLRANLPFAPGTRYDVFFDMPREAGASAAIVALLGPGVPLVAFTASADAPVPQRSDVAALPPNRLLPPEVKLQNALRRDVAIAGGATRDEAGKVTLPGDPARIWRVNGAAGAIGSSPLFSARRSQPVVLALVNTTAFVQPIHLHGHCFRLLHNLDDGWEPYWLDTVQVPEGKTARIAFVADNPGRWLIGSSVLERLDTGLWTWFEVT